MQYKRNKSFFLQLLVRCGFVKTAERKRKKKLGGASGKKILFWFRSRPGRDAIGILETIKTCARGLGILRKFRILVP